MRLRILEKVQKGELDVAVAMQLLGSGATASQAHAVPTTPVTPAVGELGGNSSHKRTSAECMAGEGEEDEIDQLISEAKKAKKDTQLNLNLCVS